MGQSFHWQTGEIIHLSALPTSFLEFEAVDAGLWVILSSIAPATYLDATQAWQQQLQRQPLIITNS